MEVDMYSDELRLGCYRKADEYVSKQRENKQFIVWQDLVDLFKGIGRKEEDLVYRYLIDRRIKSDQLLGMPDNLVKVVDNTIRALEKDLVDDDDFTPPSKQ